MAENGDNPNTLAGMLQSRARGRRQKPAPKPSLPQLGFEFPVPPAKKPPEVRFAPIVLQEPIAAPKPAVLAPAEGRVWSVRSLVANIRQQVERGYTDLWVEGEISNLRPAPSGHLYFTLKDGEAQLPIVLFRRQAQLLRFRPKDGVQVKVRGKISIYESRGQLQLIAETLEELGAGAMQRAFEQLKAKLRAEGLFDLPKKPLPPFPQCVGIVTSATGAALQDIIHVVRRRHARLNLLVYPAVVQGPQCARTVARGIRWFNANAGRVDVIVIARGGGSIEDLAGFNDEQLARVIAASELPIVSAIGHEVDFTIADFVADLRAPTPSAAAELVTAAQHRIEERVQALSARVHRAGQYHLMHARQRLARLSADMVLRRVRDGIERREQRIDELRFRLAAASDRLLRNRAQRLNALEARLRRQDPTLRLADAQRRLARAGEALQRISTHMTVIRHARLARLEGRLHALSPLAVLSRGYALVYAEDGALLRSAAGAATGQTIRARLAQGSVRATITEIQNT
ncbi:Exodeoxyribonuclease VII large subunit [Granulicella rosea]|uniref:Exodeoxyribonuclease 7 large subunit n=1 Tax=Granulicella rosea TaxID=474952 RepID=A0A239L613_9BACT|nr:exodeoxyribonuclease VII large subunit [Granulicella rosea]SNT25740.1 Exodeoxyribonuclease VII large subunit [Granulicella rosea]